MKTRDQAERGGPYALSSAKASAAEPDVLLPHLASPAAALRQVLAAHLLRRCDHIIEIGGAGRPITGYVTHRPVSVTVVDPKILPFAEERLNGAPCQVRHVQAKLQQLVAFFAKHPERAQGDVREKARATMFKINKDLFELDAEIARLAEQIKPSDDAVIAVGRRIHGGVTLQVGHKVLKVMEDKTGGQVRVIDDRITVT